MLFASAVKATCVLQVMALGTLAVCFNNHGVFTGVVKMRRGEVAKYMTSIDSMHDIHLAFAHFACVLLSKWVARSALHLTIP